MSNQVAGLTLFTVGFLALVLEQFGEPGAFVPEAVGAEHLKKFTLSEAIPALGLAKDVSYRVDPEALIHIGDPVILQGEDGVILAPYRDEVMGAVLGLVTRHADATL